MSPIFWAAFEMIMIFFKIKEVIVTVRMEQILLKRVKDVEWREEIIKK